MSLDKQKYIQVMRVKIYYHVFHNFIAEFLAFLAALWAADFVSVLFEKKNQKNLWGLTGNKTVLSSITYHHIESAVSVIVGFLMIMMVNYFFKKKLTVVISFSKKAAQAVFVKLSALRSQSKNA